MEGDSQIWEKTKKVIEPVEQSRTKHTTLYLMDGMQKNDDESKNYARGKILLLIRCSCEKFYFNEYFL